MKHNHVPVHLKMVSLRAHFAPFSTAFKQYCQWKLFTQELTFRIMQCCCGGIGTAKVSLIYLLKFNLPNLLATFQLSGSQMLSLGKMTQSICVGKDSAEVIEKLYNQYTYWGFYR